MASSRYAIISVVITFVLSATLAGCGAGGAAPGGSGAETNAALVPAGEGATSYPLTLSTFAGQTVLEKRPQRVAVVGFSSNVDYVLALGVTPVYVPKDVERPWQDQNVLAKVEVTGPPRQQDIPYEQIAGVQPDLIVSFQSTDETVVNRLAEIAPVLDYQDQPGDKYDWRAAQRLTGAALDLPNRANGVVEDADRRIAEVAAEHPEFNGKSLTMATDYGKQYGIEYFTTSGSFAEKFFGSLGFAPGPNAERFRENPKVSEESIGLLDADVLVMGYSDSTIRADREKSAGFKGLTPVRKNRYLAEVVDSGEPGSQIVWVLRRGGSASSLPWAAETLGEELGKLDLD